MSRVCWGIFRESTHSPGRESDDTEILRLTGKHLEAKGFHVELKTADEVTEANAMSAAFGPNWKRLHEVKRKYDPDNVFHLNQNIKP